MFKAARQAGICSMTSSCDKILEEGAKPQDFKRSIMVPIFKEKEYPLACEIKLLEHRLKVFEGVLE